MKRKVLPSFLRVPVVVFLSLVGLFLLYFCFEGFILDYFNNTKYQAVYLPTSGYSKELKLSALEYDDIQKGFGAPTSSVREQSADNPNVVLVRDEYPGVTIQYSEVKELDGRITDYICLIAITGEEYHFGSFRIGVGSSRMLVRIAYLLDRKIDPDELFYSAKALPNVDEGYYGEDWSRILFCYDDAGIVTSIAYEPPAF